MGAKDCWGVAVPPGISSPANPSCQSPARPATGTEQCLLGWQHPPRSVCPLRGVSPSLQFPSSISKLSAAHRCHKAYNIQINLFYKPIKLDKPIKPQPTFEYRFVL